MKHSRQITWPLDEKTYANIEFEYLNQSGNKEVMRIEYDATRLMTDDELKEAIIDCMDDRLNVVFSDRLTVSKRIGHEEISQFTGYLQALNDVCDALPELTTNQVLRVMSLKMNKNCTN